MGRRGFPEIVLYSGYFKLDCVLKWIQTSCKLYCRLRRTGPLQHFPLLRLSHIPISNVFVPAKDWGNFLSWWPHSRTFCTLLHFLGAMCQFWFEPEATAGCDRRQNWAEQKMWYLDAVEWVSKTPTHPLSRKARSVVKVQGHISSKQKHLRRVQRQWIFQPRGSTEVWGGGMTWESPGARRGITGALHFGGWSIGANRSSPLACFLTTDPDGSPDCQFPFPSSQHCPCKNSL